MDPDRFLTHSLKSTSWGGSVTRIISSAIRAVDPSNAILNNIKKIGNTIIISDSEYDLSDFSRIRIIGAGKAALPMAKACCDIIGDHLTEGIIIVKNGVRGFTENQTSNQHRKLRIIEASHPIPDTRGVEGSKEIINLLSDSKPDDLIFCLISGGGSALLNAPVQGIKLSDLQSLTGELLACGASINEINTIRKHLDIIKGGGMVKLTAPASVISLILSDVVGDPLEVIASGPTVPDPTTFQDALDILKKYGLLNSIPESISRTLKNGALGKVDETPKPGDPRFRNIFNQIIGSNQMAATAALEQVKQEKMNGLLLTTSIQGESRKVGVMLSAIAQQLSMTATSIQSPACIITGGETTVTLTGNGKGGRNQEMALSTVRYLAGLPDIIFISVATDGDDGPTNAAGAVVTGNTLNRAVKAGMDPDEYLRRNDSYTFFSALDDLLLPGPTLTNVNDLHFIFSLKKNQTTYSNLTW